MSKKPAAPANQRNGLKWRNGRPRWEPSPANRALGLCGADLRDHQGNWMDRGAAMTVADNRTTWAKFLRDAMRDDDTGGKARAALRTALDRLPPLPIDPVGRRKRELLSDLIEKGRAIIEARQEQDMSTGRRPRTVAALVEAYFADARAMRKIEASTQRSYRSSSKRFVADLGTRRVDELTPSQMVAWHEKMIANGASASVARLAIGAAGSMLQWSVLQDPPWIAQSPIQKLRLTTPRGRRVYWTMAEEHAFIEWCDANGYEDVADAVTVCLWTGARQIDVCAANVEDLSGNAWRFIPIKTSKKGLEALPAILPVVAKRVERRRIEAAATGVLHLSGTPMLYNKRARQRHNSISIGDRFIRAKEKALAAGVMPEGFEGKRLQDCRDTCITRLFDADISLNRITAWTGHAASAAETILREHYITLRETGAMNDAAKLQVWANKEGVQISA